MEGKRQFILGYFQSKEMRLNDVMQELSQSWSKRHPKPRCPVVIFLDARSSESPHHLQQETRKLAFKTPLEQCFVKRGPGTPVTHAVLAEPSTRHRELQWRNSGNLLKSPKSPVECIVSDEIGQNCKTRWVRDLGTHWELIIRGEVRVINHLFRS